MRIYKTKWMARFARRAGIADAALRDAIRRAERGIVDADLGGGLIKQRVAREGQGRSGGYRMVVVYRRGDRAVYLSGFAKNERDNIDDDELASLRDVAEAWLAAAPADFDRAVRDGVVQEISDA